MPYEKGGKVRAIATSGARRSPALPELPTIAEAGVPGYEYTPWYGMFGPGTLPKPLVARLNTAVNKALDDPELGGKLAQQGLEVRDGERPVHRDRARRRGPVGKNHPRDRRARRMKRSKVHIGSR